MTVLIPELNAGFIVLTNSESPAYAVMANKIRDLLTAAPDRDYISEAKSQLESRKKSEAERLAKDDAVRQKGTTPTLSLSAYTGTFRDQMYGDIKISLEDNRLVMRFLPAPNFVADLEHWHYDTFVIKWRPSVSYNFPRGFVTFSINRQGVADAITIDQPNNDFWFYELSPKRVGN